MFHEKTQTDKVRYSCTKEISPKSPPPPLACLLFSKHYEKCVPTFFCMQALFNRLCPAKKGVRTFAPVMMKRLQV